MARAEPFTSISMTPMTPDERKSASGGVGADIASLGCFALFVGGGMGTCLWLAGGWIGSFISPAAQNVGRWIGVLITAAVYVVMSTKIIRYGKKEKQLAKEDFTGATVEEIRVRSGRVLELSGDHSSIDPVLCVDLGEGRLLLLVGQWLWTPSKYGVPRGDEPEVGDDITENIPNGLPDPWSFPSESFVLRRLPKSGHVFSIKVQGKFVKPESSDVVLSGADGRRYLQSMILNGTIDDVKGALDRLPTEKD